MSDPLQLDHLRVVLVGTRNPLNLGAAARAMSNFGFEHLRVVGPYECAFREARSARGGAEVLARAEEFATVAEAVADCTLVVGTTAARARELQHPLRGLVPGGRRIRKEMAAGRIGLLFGSEKRGLLNEDLAHCHWLIRIPTGEPSSSMNLGQAVAVTLYELIRSERRQPPPPAQKLATGTQIERVSELLNGMLAASGYTQPNAPEGTAQKVRRLVRRLNLQSGDAELLLGMLRQMQWKMNSQQAKS